MKWLYVILRDVTVAIFNRSGISDIFCELDNLRYQVCILLFDSNALQLNYDAEKELSDSMDIKKMIILFGLFLSFNYLSDTSGALAVGRVFLSEIRI